MSNILNKIGKNLLGLMLPLACVGSGLTSCADEWNSHYEVSNSGGSSLWEMISQNGQTSNFATLLKATGYDVALASSQSFTVFAPNDQAFTKEMCDSLIAVYQEKKENGVKDDKNSVITEFVKNHVALFNYSVSSLTNDTIFMQNGKRGFLKSGGMSSSNFVQQGANLQASNGVLFVLDKVLPFQFNIYQYLERDPELDSISRFIHSYDVYYLDEEQSIKGGIVNGKQEYIDSVIYLYNNMFSYLATINNEDSAFMAFLPTNEIWEQQLKKNIPYFQYDEKVIYRDSFMYMYPRLQILEESFFSRTFNPEDSLNSYMRTSHAYLFGWGKGHVPRNSKKFARYYYFFWSNPVLPVFDYYFARNCQEPVVCSNGEIYKWNADSAWFSANSLIRNSILEMECENCLDSVNSKTTKRHSEYHINGNNKFYDQISENAFVEIAPKTLSGKYEVLFDVYNVLSNVPYDVYVVTVPKTAADSTATPKGSKFVMSKLYCNDASGKQIKLAGSTTKPVYETSPTEIDTIMLAENLVFPTCSYHLDDAQVKIQFECKTANKDYNTGLYDYTTRFDKIILVPKY